MNFRRSRNKKPKYLGWFFITKPAAATMELWKRWKSNAKRRYPVRYFLQETIPSRVRRQLQKIRDGIYFIRCRTVDKYHILNLKETMGIGYREPDAIMLYANFHILIKYFEECLAYKNISQWKKTKKLFERFDKKARIKHGLAMAQWYIEQNHETEAYEKLIRLYLWWTVERDQRVDTLMDDRFITKYEISVDTDEFYSRQDQAMLELLVSLRYVLWS